ncbi:MAG: hypothetical protein MUD04_04175 [Cyanobium sp. Prado107]|nr:hypothetical protein [Cyanobium sp. Prado107]
MQIAFVALSLLLPMADPYGRSPALKAFSFEQLVSESFPGGGLISAFAPALARQPRDGSGTP